MSEHKFPTEEVELPSKGLVYPPEHPLSSGKVEIKYMTAKEEDILTNQAYIQNGTVLDKLLESVVVSKVNVKDLVTGDKNSILVATRILGYGKDYEFEYGGEKHKIDLSLLENKDFNDALVKDNENSFKFVLPATGDELEFKLMTHGDEQQVQAEVTGLKKINKDSSAELSTRLKYMIIAINGDSDRKTVREYVDNRFLARDSRAFRKHIQELSPDVDMRFYPENGPKEGVTIPIGISFLWPDANL